MSNPTHLHHRIRPAAVYFYRFGGLFSLLLAYLMSQEPRSPELYMRLLEQSLIVIAVGFAAYAFMKPLLVYEIHIDPDSLTLSRLKGLQKVVIARENIISYTYHKGHVFGSNPTEHLTLFTSKSRYVLDASDYANFEQIKHEITKGVKRKY